MHNFFQLLKIQFYTNFKINKLNKKGLGKRLGGYAGLFIYGLLIVLAIGYLFGYTYTESFFSVLTIYGKPEQLLTLIIAVSTLVAFMLSFYSMTSVLFNFKDYDMLCSMPIKRSTIVGSKFAYAFITDFALSIVIVIGCFIKLSMLNVYTLDAVFIIKTLFITIVSPFFALTFATLIGTLFAYIASKFRRKNLVQTILLFVFFIGYFALTFFANDSSVDISTTISKIFFIYDILNGAINGESIYVLYYVLVCVAPFAILAVIIGLAYSKLNTLFTSKKTLRNFKLKSYTGKSELKTLVNKEFKTLFSTPVYAINSLLGAIMGFVLSISLSILFRSLFLKSGINLSEFASEICVYACMGLAFMFMLAPTTNCSIALEGKAYWLVKTSPIKTSNWFLSKLIVNAIFYTPVGLVAGVVVSICLQTPILVAILYTLVAVVLSILCGIFGLFSNILFPHLNWENSNQAVKQGMSVFITVLSAFVLPAIFYVVSYFIPISVEWILTIYLAFVSLLTVVLYIVVFIKGDKILDKRIK